MRYKIISVLLSLTVVLSVVTYTLYKNVEKNSVKMIQNREEKLIAYDQFSEFCSAFRENIKLEGFRCVTYGYLGAAFEPEVAFGSRSNLNYNSTSERTMPTVMNFMLENEACDKQIIIGLIFTDHYMGRNYLGYNSYIYAEDTRSIVEPITNTDIYSFDNLMLTVNTTTLESSKSKVDSSVILAEIPRALVETYSEVIEVY